MAQKELVRTASGRLLWSAGLLLVDEKSEALAAGILAVSSSISICSIIILIVELCFGFYYGGSLFASLLIPLLGWSAIRCASRFMLALFTLANGIVFAIFLATTLPFMIWIFRSSAWGAAWFWVFMALTILLAGLHVTAFVYGIQASCRRGFFAPPVHKEVFTHVTPQEASFLYLGGPVNPRTIYVSQPPHPFHPHPHAHAATAGAAPHKHVDTFPVPSAVV
jgi:hypothetical protein